MKKRLISIFLLLALSLSITVPAFAAYQPEGYYTNQDVTGYFDDLSRDGDKDGSGYDKPASGVEYEVGHVAVHPQVWGTTNWNKPIFPFGAIISIHHDDYPNNPLGDPIPTPIGEISVFQVQDTGELTNKNGYTFHWFDVYCGRAEDYGWTDLQLQQWIERNIEVQKRNYYVSY